MFVAARGICYQKRTRRHTHDSVPWEGYPLGSDAAPIVVLSDYPFSYRERDSLDPPQIGV